MRCPKCRDTDLVQKKLKNTELSLDYCQRCLGVWFDANELENVLDVAVKDLVPPSKSEGRSPLCPKCYNIMTAFYYPQTLVLIDMCKKCNGIWLDNSEFAEIKFVRKHLKKQDLLEEYAPVQGLKGVFLRFIESAILQLKFWE